MSVILFAGSRQPPFLAPGYEKVLTCIIIALFYLFFFKDCLERDPCCEPKGCKLKPGSQCSVLNHACCQECVVSFKFPCYMAGLNLVKAD